MVSITFQPTTEDMILFIGGGEVAERRIRLFIDELPDCGYSAVCDGSGRYLGQRKTSHLA
nr:hypothetical protein [Veillonella denticariosi]